MDPAQELELAALSRQKSMNDVIGRGDSDIQRFYSDVVVFITGGSGFLGKQLIEKLFRSCNVSKVFLLLRAKKGKDTKQRLEEILKEPVFDTLRKQQPHFASKLAIVEGDISEIKLGLQADDWNTLTKEVEVIFHVAATTKFDETLRLSTLINVRGTREVLSLGKACLKLRSFVHVSTAYTHATSNLIGAELEEDFYKTPILPETMISMAETLDGDRLLGITEELIKNWPNTYTFTKAIGEEIVRTSSSRLPICIVRPGIVLCSYNEPSPGWIDVSSIYGATGFVLGLGLGLLHAIHCKTNAILGIIPCDYVNNAILAAGKETATEQTKGGNNTPIYTVSTTQRNPVRWVNITDTLQKHGPNIATPSAIYYSFAHDSNFKWIFMMLSLFLHFIPAYIADFVCLLIGKERRFTKTAQKVYKMCNKLSYFLTNEWQFADTNLNKLYQGLSDTDKAIFNFDVCNINWTEYVIVWCLGVRKYIIKDGLKNTKPAIRKQQILRVVHYIFMMLYIYSIWKVLGFMYYITAYLSSFVINSFCVVYKLFYFKRFVIPLLRSFLVNR